MEIQTKSASTQQVFKGELEFISLFKPIKLYVFKDEIEYIDLSTHFFKVMEYLDDRRTTMIDDLKQFELRHDMEADRKLKYRNDGKYIAITLNNATGMSNIGAYMPNAMQRFNGMKVIATITESSIRIEPDPEHKNHEVYYTHDNSCALEPDHIKDVCKPGTRDTCIFLTLGGTGFMCEKFNSSMASTLLNRFSEGNMNASRIGSCAIAGRKDAPKPKITLEQYPDIQRLVANKAKYIGWRLIDSGDAMDHRMFGNETMGTVVTDILFELDSDQTSASLTIKGKDFDCGMNVKYGGGVRKFTDDADAIHFYGYMGHSFVITKE